MATVAELGLKVDSSQVARGTVELQKMSGAAKGAETSARALSGAADQEAAALQRATGAMTANTAAARINGAAVAQAARMSTMMTRQLSFQLIDIAQTIPLAFQSPLYALQNVGFQIAQIGQLYMGQGGIRAALTDIAGVAGRVAGRLAGVGAAAGIAAVGVSVLTDNINDATGAAYSFGDIAIASIQVLADGIASILKPAIDAIAPWFASAWEFIKADFARSFNILVGGSVQIGKAIGAAFMSIVPVAKLAGESAANWLISTIEEGVNRVLKMLDTIPGVDLSTISMGRVDFGGAAAGDQLSNMWGGVAEAGRTDYFGQFQGAVAAQAAANAAKKLGEEVKGTAGEISSLNDMFSDSMRAAQREFRFYQDTFSGFFMDLKDGLRDGESFFQAFGNAASNALDQILSRIIEMSSNQLFGQLFGGFFGVAPGQAAQVPLPMARPAGLFHTGGIVGAEGASRYVHPAYFDDAPRYHSGGIAGDEVPAILRRGEGVFTQGQMAAMGGGDIVIQNYGAQVQAKRERGPDGRTMTRILVNAVKDDFAAGGFDAPMKGRYPVRPKRF